MNKKILYLATSLVLVFTLSACNGALQIALPTTDAATASSRTTSTGKYGSADPINQQFRGHPFRQSGQPESAYEMIYDQVAPSVVTIDVTLTVTQSAVPNLPFPFNQQTPQQPFQEAAAGSGFVWDTEGHIVTNNHVVDGATSISVKFHDGTIVSAKVVGADAASDLAVLKVDVPASELKPIEVMDSTTVKVGQIAIAIGNPFQLSDSMSTGIISGIGRSLQLSTSSADGLSYSIPDIIQTDAAINPGNSGGALVDIQGRLIGVTSAIESPVRANSGVGYVIPSIIVSKVVPVLIETGSYQQPYIGISGTDMNPDLPMRWGWTATRKAPW